MPLLTLDQQSYLLIKFGDQITEEYWEDIEESMDEDSDLSSGKGDRPLSFELVCRLAEFGFGMFDSIRYALGLHYNDDVGDYLVPLTEEQIFRYLELSKNNDFYRYGLDNIQFSMVSSPLEEDPRTILPALTFENVIQIMQTGAVDADDFLPSRHLLAVVPDRESFTVEEMVMLLHKDYASINELQQLLELTRTDLDGGSVPLLTKDQIFRLAEGNGHVFDNQVIPWIRDALVPAENSSRAPMTFE